MKKLDKKSFLGLLALGAALLVILFSGPKALPQEALTIHTAQGEKHFSVEIAADAYTQAQGLMHRETLAPDHGMLFIWPEDGTHDMWMKNTLIPLDMLFVDAHGTIVAIAENTTPLSLTPIRAGKPTRAVIELAGGVTKARGIAPGDRVQHRFFTP